MTRLSCLPLCLALAILAGTASSQVMSDTVSINIFLVNMTFSDRADLTDNMSQSYMDMTAKINDYISPIGGEREKIIVSDGGNCVKVNIAWRNGNQTILADVVEKLQRDGFIIWNQTWGVSFTGCQAEPSQVRFTFYLNLTWSENFRDHNSTEYQTLFQAVKDAYTGLGGSIQALEIAQNNGCSELYVEWNAENSARLMDITESLTTNGLMVFDRQYKVTSAPCTAPPAEPSQVRFTFYLNLTWSENFRDHNSTQYQTLLQAVKDAYTGLGGSIQALEIAQNNGCSELYVEWNAENSARLMDITESLTTNGLMVFDRQYKVTSAPCTAPPAEPSQVRFTFYLNLTWSENFRDHNSTQYQTLLQAVKDAYTGLGGSIQALEIAQNNGCSELYVEWNAENSARLMDITESLTTNGLMVFDRQYKVTSAPCTAPPAESSQVRFTFYLNLPWSENFKDHNSTEYQTLWQAVKDAYTGLGGSIQALEIAKNNGCIELYVEWNAEYSTRLMDITESLATNGLRVFDQQYKVMTTSCTAPPAETTDLRFTFYVGNMKWSERFRNHDSPEYQEVKTNVVSHLNGLGGGIRALEIAQNYDCLEFYLEWSTAYATSITDMLSELYTQGITVSNRTYSVQSQPCQIPEAEIDGCAEVTEGFMGMCSMACDDDNSTEAQNCSDGFKCCSNGCGYSCQRVGYVLAINSVIIINMNPVDGASEQYSSVLLQHQVAVKSVVKNSFNVEIPDLVTDAELRDMSPYSVDDQNLTAVGVTLYLTQDVPNEKLKQYRDRLMKGVYSTEYDSFRIIDVRFGSNPASVVSMCGNTECYGICKKYRQNIEHCSCDLGYIGSNCATFDCRMRISNSTYHLCQNGGECVRKQSGLDYECQCQPGSIGSMCQVDLNSCPVLMPRRPGLIGLCRSTCTTGVDCEEEQKCCQVSCGGQSCVEIGYMQKLAARVTIDFPFIAQLSNSSSFEFEILKSQLEIWINTTLSQYTSQGFKSATVVKFQSSLDEQVTRKRRELGYTIMHLELRFTKQVPVESMLEIQDSLLANSFYGGEANWTVSNITFGTNGGCPYLPCASGSFCVTNFGGDNQCACPKHRSGQLCDVLNCSPEGMNVCKNGGTCKYSDTEMKMSCECPTVYSGELCEEMTNVCALQLCINGGTCYNLPGGRHYCACPAGFSGSVCENAANHCPTGQPLMTTNGEQQCRRQGCPAGFMCNADPIDRWTACCLKKDVFCESNPCKSGGTCISDFDTGTMCRCPIGSNGLFCEETSNDTVVPTACQSKQLFNDWVINILKTGDSSVISLTDMRVILQHMGYKYFPTDICDEQGNFTTLAQGVLVVNPSAKRVPICMDKSGNYDSSCAAAICDVLSSNGSMPFCINGGRCIGDITQKLCDCMGTGYHGVRCELTGEDNNGTDCKLRQDIAYMALGILNGSADLMLGYSKETTQATIKDVLGLYNTNNIFVPYCDDAGRYEYRGCLYLAADISKKNCYCAEDDGTMFGTEENPWEPPQNCQKGSCPKEWGEECVQPEWWCLDTLQCQADSQRCAYFTGCTGAACKQEAEVGCVTKGIILSCDPHPCKDDPFRMCQPCGIHGTCLNVGTVNNTASMGYRCECKMGFSGPECNVNDKVCTNIPGDLCESGCVGDIDNGELCKCEPGYAGIFCDKPARSPCEKRKALFDDAINILSGNISPFNGHTVAELQSLVRFFVQAVDAEAIQVLNCTEKGFYAEVQHSVSVNNLQEQEYTCVNFYGNMISSNVKPYIGYDICTTPSDPQALAASACNTSADLGSGELPICLNGGSCAFDMYAGKFCSCPPGYYGQFCQYQGDPSAYNEPRSVCEFFAEAWNIAHEISTGKAYWIDTMQQIELYLNLSYNFVKMQSNESYALKTECRMDGTFKPAACYYDIMTGEKGPCYCWNLRRLLVEGPQVESSESNQCTDMSDSTCPKKKCRYICEHGYRIDNSGCRSCDCKNPCEDMTCEKGQRCVIEKSKPCDPEGLELCGQAVCRSFDKPGACPDYSVAIYPGELLPVVRNSSFCNVTCYDDTDCEGDQKCCGVCGNTCVQPLATNSCEDYRSKMLAELQFITMTRDEFMTTRNYSPAEMRMFERITDIQHMWVPTCEDDANQFTPLQCEFDINSNGLGNISSCFCVDRWGKRIEGAHANASDPSSCDIKPYTCPFVDAYSNTARTCSRDLDCDGNEKCCGGDGSQVCQMPVDASTLATTLGTFMSTLCENNADMCQGGSRCVGAWDDTGVACECPNNRTGPFCELSVSDVMEVPRTTCERKYLAIQEFLKELDGMNSSLKLNKRLPASDDMQISIISAVMYNCTADGGFEPKQSIVNAHNMDSPLQYFCVFENGTEIVGTRKSISDGQSVFCGGNNMTCPHGEAYRGNNGDLLMCEGEGECPEEYVCQRSTYGRFYCCPPDKGEIISDCMSKQREAMRSSLKTTNISDNDCGMTHVPACEADGTWSREQCNSILGVCWCVTPKGHYINNTMTKSVPQCQTVSESMIAAADLSQTDVSQVNFSVCNSDQDFHCCNKALCRQMCWAHPEAVCRINPCNGCAAEFYTSDGQMADCNEGLKTCQLEQKQAKTVIQERQINVALSYGVDIDDVANSSKSSQGLSKSRSLSKDYPERCQLPPSTGRCKGFMPQWYFDSASGTCDRFVWGMCLGNDNRFNSPEECYAYCSPSSNPCQNSSCSFNNTICKLKYNEDCYAFNTSCNVTSICIDREPDPYLLKDVYVPSCQETGEYNYKQCQGSYCWCVDSTGHYVNGLTIEQSALLVCSENGTSQQISTADGTCPSGQMLNMACLSACTNKVCPSNPEAICVVDLCSSNCTTKFIDAQDQEVKCTDDRCEVFSFETSEECTEPIPCPGMSVKTCSESICESALKQNCSSNPCAVCMLDPCTCQPYFVDARTQNKLTKTQCTYLSVGLCEEEQCAILNKNEGENHLSANDLPNCDGKGIFEPTQCKASICQCVDQFGKTAVRNADGSCTIDILKRIKVTFTYKADFNNFKSNNRLQTIVEMLVKRLTDAGIDPMIIKNTGDPYEGSIKVDMTFEDNESSNNKDLAMVSKKMDTMARNGELDLTIDSQYVGLSNITQEFKTKSQLAAENEGEQMRTHDDGDSLDTTEKIIIGVVCGAVGLLIICIITFCLCYKRREHKKALDDSFEHVRVHDSKLLPSNSPMPVYNQVYEDDENSMKVRL